MSGFKLTLASPARVQQIDAVDSFIGQDASGQFGLLGGHEPFITVLEWGLARFRSSGSTNWRYLALPGGTLRFRDDRLEIATRSFVLGDALETVRSQLEHETRVEAVRRASLRSSLDQIEQALMQRLWRMEA